MEVCGWSSPIEVAESGEVVCVQFEFAVRSGVSSIKLFGEEKLRAMGRAGRVAPRICSTLELRTHASSLTVSLPATASKTVPLSPPSPGTPGQVAPASVRSVLQAWPVDALQVVQRQMEALRSQSSESSEPLTRKRELESSEPRERCEISQDADAQGFEVALQTQPALPEDWEQVLDLKVTDMPVHSFIVLL